MTKQSQLVALIVPDIVKLVFAALAKCVEDECAAQGYSLIVANSDDSRESEQALLRRLTSRGVDGVLLIPARESCAAGAGAALREDVERVTCPVVLIDRLTQCGWCDAVGFDNYLGGRLAAQYLLEGGAQAHRHRDRRCGRIERGRPSPWFRGCDRAGGERFDPALCVSGDYVSMAAIMLPTRLPTAVRPRVLLQRRDGARPSASAWRNAGCTSPKSMR